MTAAFPSDPAELVQRTMTECSFSQDVNFSDVEIAGVMGLVDRFTSMASNAALESGDYSAMQLRSEQQSVVHGVVAENAGDMNAFTAHSTQSSVRANEAQQFSVQGTVAASVAQETGAKAAALEQVSRTTQAQIEREMKLHSVIEETAKRDTAVAELSLENEAAAAVIDKDAVKLNPLKLA
jgi:hypothetical protein